MRLGAAQKRKRSTCLAAVLSCSVLSESRDAAGLQKQKKKKEKTGNVLLSQAASRQVSSALRSLTSVFEMGTGVASPLLSPDFLFF